MENIFFMVFAKTLADLKIMRTFAPAIERESVGRETIKIIGALVQLVRIHACHAWGHGFESRTHRQKHEPSHFFDVRAHGCFASMCIF